ncbi:hypothetical protein [Halomonas sp. BM-2019]|uniref:hypothetical protein n=1 Tax=Halomonas sp. BM-2019 TaxID=2811227 RepID=UPI001B3C1F67|nr:MAG: hypothetical protein J5F18_01900 [Halomonas sp. BM-2019]
MVAGGWQAGTASGYDRATVLYTEDLLGYARKKDKGGESAGQNYNPRLDLVLFVNGITTALSDHEKLSMPLLEVEETGRQFALLILKLLAGGENRASG